MHRAVSLRQHGSSFTQFKEFKWWKWLIVFAVIVSDLQQSSKPSCTITVFLLLYSIWLAIHAMPSVLYVGGQSSDLNIVAFINILLHFNHCLLC